MSEPRLFPLQPVQDFSVFKQNVLSLLEPRAPLIAWIDNTSENYRFWNLSSLYAENGVLTRSAMFSLGEYQTVICKGASINETGEGFCVTGKFAFMTDIFTFTGEGLTIEKDGTLKFCITITSPENIGIGLEHAITSICPDFGDTVPSVIRSPLLNMSAPINFNVQFMPFSAGNTYFSLAQNYELSTCFTTIYGEPIKILFPHDFRFVFQHRATRSGRRNLYLAPSGIAKGVTEGLFMLGLSGTEYVRLPKQYTVKFHSDMPALWEDVALKAEPQVPYISISDCAYHCQSKHSRYYRVPENLSDTDLRHYQELPGAPIGDNVVLPVMPFSGTQAGAEAALRLEQNYIYPTRRDTVVEAVSKLNKLGNDSIEAATRHGLRTSISNGQTTWLRLAITEEIMPQMSLTNINHELLLRLLADNMFMPLNDPQYLTPLHAGTPYSITNSHLDLAKNNDYQHTEKLRALCGTMYLNRESFEDELRRKGASIDELIIGACDHFNVTADSWRFLCSLSFWEKSGAVMVLKFTDNDSVSNLAKTPNMWSCAPDDGKAKAFQKTIEDLEAYLKETPNRELEEILLDKNWCGTVVFNCVADVKNLPEELRFLAGGIDSDKFKAQFIAFPADTGKEQSARICALIDYRDDIPLRCEDYRDYAFKVMRLRVCIRNSRVYDFGAKVQLLVNELFGCPASAYDRTAGNSVTFNGSYQTDGNTSRYVFVLDKPEEYGIQNSLIDGVCMESAALLANSSGCRFTFSGVLRFNNIGETDILSYSSLPFGGMAIIMNSSGSGYSFIFDAEHIFIEPAVGETRDNSFVNKFPATPIKIMRRTGATPQDSGYTPLWVQGAEQGDISYKDWYGILWEINPGDLGNLSGANSTIEILTAWQPDSKRSTSVEPVRSAYTGIRLGSAGSPDDWGLPLQGVMTLTFDAIELHRTAAESVRYHMLFRNFALKILGIRFPSSDNGTLYLISDEQRRIGWYGAVGG
ncbi:MAG: hypothetical protein FWC15_03415 [Fibromonadales bacterium]|nr:hypothetical protein [Fibromonadales bacterium]